MKKKIAILGSTGSIGSYTLQLIREFAEHFEITGLSTFKNVERLIKQAEEFNVKRVCICDPVAYEKAKNIARQKNIELLFGESGIIRITTDSETEIVVNAIVGAAGLSASIKALETGKRLCLANKESLVIAGEHIVKLAHQKGELIPIDSEHSALFQAMKAGKKSEIKRIILTASGGPVWHKPNTTELSVDEALQHPCWSMGKKITVDSSTMINKGFEIIEAHWLFDLPFDKIEVLIHPESIVHSIVEFVDNSLIAQMSYPDMRIPIQYALFYPNRVASNQTNILNLTKVQRLTFFEPPLEKYTGLVFAREIGQKGGNLPAALVVADDIVVSAFLERKISFTQIVPLIKEIVEKVEFVESPSLETLIETMQITKELANQILTKG